MRTHSRKLFTSRPARTAGLAIVSIAVVAGLAGCVVAARGPGAVAYVDVPPPAAYVETIPVTPGTGYVWVGGYYSWAGGRYVWNRGHWTLPPSGFRAWNAGYWHRDHRGHYWVPGHWR